MIQDTDPTPPHGIPRPRVAEVLSEQNSVRRDDLQGDWACGSGLGAFAG